jgi:penicillin G amidase
MKRTLRGVLVALGAAAGLCILVAAGWLVLTRMSFPVERGTVKLPGLTAPVSIVRDKFGVPHIYGKTSQDLFFAQGYVHAQDRFWQMEFWRRIGAGRLSELFGRSQLQTDIFLRTLGLARVAQEEYALADAGFREALDAYAAGVNAYILKRPPARLGLEFAVLELTGVSVKIEPWTPVNSLTWAKMMALTLCGNWEDEALVTRLLGSMGTKGLARFFTPYRAEMPFIVSDEENGAAGAPPAAVSGLLPSLLVGDNEAGSNSWVIGGTRTATGKPILANDMHLEIQMPSIWYEVGLHGVTDDGRTRRTDRCPLEVRGFSFPGVPGVISGHNDRIAWGLTNLPGDVQDLYVERINPDNPDQYEVDGRWRDMSFAYEDIRIKGEDEPYRLRVRVTRHGPIISDHGPQSALAGYTARPGKEFPGSAEITAVSMRWTALEPSTILKAVLSMDTASNYREFRDALRLWDVPAQNVVYADVDGNIAYQSAGRFPIRASGRGVAPVPGWTELNEWTGSIPYEELPRSFNPRKGYIVTANNAVTSGADGHLLMAEPDYGYRARRIVEMIESHRSGITFDDVRAMHADVLNHTALEICAALKDLDPRPTPLETQFLDEKRKELSGRKQAEWDKKQGEDLAAMREARDLLAGWDGRMEGASAAAALYASFWVQLVSEVFRDQYPESEWPMSQSSRAENALHTLLHNPQDAAWDDVTTPLRRETRDEILVRAFRKGYADLVRKEGKSPEKWRWDRIHKAAFVNASLGKSGIGPIEKIFNRGPYPVGGGATQVNAAAWNRKKPFEVTLIPSMRMIVDLGNLQAAVSVHSTGQSGHPYHRHYDDFIAAWRGVQYHSTLWRLEDVKGSRHAELVLLPP